MALKPLTDTAAGVVVIVVTFIVEMFIVGRKHNCKLISCTRTPKRSA